MTLSGLKAEAKFWAFWSAVALLQSDTHDTSSPVSRFLRPVISHVDCPPCLKKCSNCNKYNTLRGISLGTLPTIRFPLFVHTAKPSSLFASSIDTESTSPSQRNTDDDAEPSAESEDEEELEENETSYDCLYLHGFVTCQTRMTSHGYYSRVAWRLFEAIQ